MGAGCAAVVIIGDKWSRKPEGIRGGWHLYRCNLSSSEYRQIKKEGFRRCARGPAYFLFRSARPFQLNCSRCSGPPLLRRYTSNPCETYCFTRGNRPEEQGVPVYFSRGKVVLMNCLRFCPRSRDTSGGGWSLIGLMGSWCGSTRSFSSFASLFPRVTVPPSLDELKNHRIRLFFPFSSRTFFSPLRRLCESDEPFGVESSLLSRDSEKREAGNCFQR